MGQFGINAQFPEIPKRVYKINFLLINLGLALVAVFVFMAHQCAYDT